MAVPGELRGMETAWKRWGKLKWEELFVPVIDLARKGFPVSAIISGAIEGAREDIYSGKYPGLV